LPAGGHLVAVGVERVAGVADAKDAGCLVGDEVALGDLDRRQRLRLRRHSRRAEQLAQVAAGGGVDRHPDRGAAAAGAQQLLHRTLDERMIRHLGRERVLQVVVLEQRRGARLHLSRTHPLQLLHGGL